MYDYIIEMEHCMEPVLLATSKEKYHIFQILIIYIYQAMKPHHA